MKQAGHVWGAPPLHRRALWSSFRLKYGRIIIVQMKFDILLDARRRVSTRKFLRVQFTDWKLETGHAVSRYHLRSGPFTSRTDVEEMELDCQVFVICPSMCMQ